MTVMRSRLVVVRLRPVGAADFHSARKRQQVDPVPGRSLSVNAHQVPNSCNWLGRVDPLRILMCDYIVTSKRPGMYRYALTPRRLVPPEELKQYESNRIKQLTAVISSTPKLEHAHIQHTQMCLYVVRSVSQVGARCLALFRDTACKCIILAWELCVFTQF